MAKLSGPEDFFEVFSDKQAKQSSGDRPAEHRPLEPRVGPASQGKTVAIQVRTLVIACISAVLLIVLSYFVGLSNRPEARPLGSKANQPGGRSDIGGATDQAGAVDDRDEDAGRSAPAPRKAWVLRVASYVENEKNRKLAAKLKEHVEENVDVAAYVFPHVTEDGRYRVVCIGPFESKDDPSAVRVKNMIGQLPPYEGVNFQEASFGIITFRPPP